MPPVRWKPLSALLVCIFHLVFYTNAQIRQDAVSMTADGWKPIVGTRRPGYYEFNSESSDIYKYEVFSTPTPTNTALPPTASAVPERKPFRGSLKQANKPTFEGNKFSGRKVPHQKHPQLNPYYTLPSYDSHGPHIPLSAVIHTRPSQIGHIKPLVTSIKPFIQISPSNKRNIKPVRIQTSTNNYRDDIFTASATSGTYTHFKTPTSNIRTRETIDLGLPGANHYSINQPHTHLEFTNRFALPSTSESVFQQYNNPSIPAFIFAKHPQTNDINYQFTNQEDFTRNLVPPPQIYRNKEVGSEKVKDKGKTQENVVLQVPPPFHFQNVKDPVQVQVTREKIQEFHNNVPPGFDGQYVEYDFSGVRQPTVPSKPVYEVTEGKWEQPPSQRPIRTRKPSQPKRRPEINSDVPVFLPTPYKPDGQSGIIPTSPTQSEVSTIFTKLSKLQREKAFTTPSPNDYNVKEVSTHYPVFGKPVFANTPPSDEISNDITTLHEEVVTTTKEPQRIRPHRRRRPDPRRTTTTTTTEQPEVVESYDSQRTQENEASQSIETERPVRIRRPSRYRTTTPPPSDTSDVTTKPSRGRNRYRNRNSESTSSESIRKRIRPLRTETTPVSEETYERSSESEAVASEKSEEIEDNPKAETIELELPGRHYITESPQKIRYETIRPFIVITTTEKAPTTNLVVPENEVDSTTLDSVEETTTTTTSAPTTTIIQSSSRIRGRPLKFDNSNRPRFSVKDYRQKLSQYSTSTTTSEPHRSTDSPRIRLPSRLRRPTTSTIANHGEESTEPVRSRFVPKDPRHSGTTEDTNVAIITEKNVKSVNTRLRPFGRYKSTTAATTTTTPKVSIKPNLFNRKRPSMISLKSRIYNKYKNNTETTTEKVTTTEENEVEETTLEYDDEESTTERSKIITEENLEVDTTTVGDISKIDANLYSARVSDLTSSAKNDYNTFKSVAPTSRRIPNYFTIATDDPILPIEAFFPNIKDKIREKDS
ncbi:mucin-5AC-like [Tribolium madens]|uniref:mucin-5AC-like n=1 Tax=Tribolium madens TaxID=41895 RepID=UPI001CF7377A|nr:mucin-5AC-like [Tribolium madens]